MSNDLVIVESPAKARTLTRMLGGQYVIRASMGHVRDLPERSLGVDVAHGFAPVYQETPSRHKVISELKSLAGKTDTVYLATDPDREGEAIAWHLAELLKAGHKKLQFRRVAFHEITQPAVTAAFQQPGVLNQQLVDAQQARRVLDRLVGYMVSPLLWKRIERGTSAGRVQSVALRLICEREAEIQQFKPEEYWLLTATFTKVATAESFQARLVRIDQDKAAVRNAAEANALATDAEHGQYVVTNIEKTPKGRRAPPPFITSTLQQAASANLHLSPEQTMRIAQELYEGIENSPNPVGLITYMRTDSVNVAAQAQAAARTFIEQEFGPEFVPATPNRYRSKAGAQEAHEAIRPTDVRLTPKDAEQFLSPLQAKVYRLIWNRFMASQMAPARLLQYAVELSSLPGTSQRQYTFRASCTRVLFAGFLQVYNLHDVEDEEEDTGKDLPELALQESCRLDQLQRDQKFTEPPRRFTEASLVRELERNGVGRPSTYASIINTIKKRDYVQVQKRMLVPTDLGTQVNAWLVQAMPLLFEVGFTARMESELDQVEAGQVNWQQMMDTFYQQFLQWLASAKAAKSVVADGPARLLAVFPPDLTWDPPRPVGRRVYDDHKFHASLQQQLADGKAFTDVQWQALIKLAARYRQRLPGLPALGAELGITELLDAATPPAANGGAGPAAPDPAQQRLCAVLAGVKDWRRDERGKKVYDDGKFFRSLRDQLEGGRQLSPAQAEALKKLALKYRDQIPDYAALQTELGLPEPAVLPLSPAQITTLFQLLAEIKQWEAPRMNRGKRRSDREFLESLAKQFHERGTMTPRQLEAALRVISRYRDQIPDFATRTAGIEFPAANAPRTKVPAAPTGVKCPKCGEGELVRRMSRRGPFYGCNRYPKCKCAVSELPGPAAAGTESPNA